MPETLENVHANLAELAENPYPGRGIALGLNALGDTALQVYWVMGRSENSRNRVLVEEDDVVRTAAHDESKVEDPRLIIYNAMRTYLEEDTLACHIVTNGDQTDTIIDGLAAGKAFETSLLSEEYEPDAPNFTPRISGIVVPYAAKSQSPDGLAERGLSVIRKESAGSDKPVRKYYRDILTAEHSGTGKCVHTYLGDSDPLPAFDRKPFVVPVGEGINDTAEMYWDNLDADNRVALVVKGIHLATGLTDYRIINAHES